MMSFGGLGGARRRAWFESGRWIPWTFVGGFVIVVAVNLTLLLLSLGTWPGLETHDAYEKGLAYNDVLDAASAQAARGWSNQTTYSDGELRVTITDASGAGIEGLRVIGILVRPTHEGLDQRVVLTATGGGTYAAKVALPFAGNWDLRLRAEGSGEPWFASTRLWVR